MKQKPKKQKKENPTQRDAFLSYFNLGGERSLDNLRQEYEKGTPKRVVSIHTLRSWCKKYKWTERVQTMDQEVLEKSEQMAIKEATAKKSDILKSCKNTMVKYNQAILSGDLIPTASDFRKMWEIARIELGRSIGQDMPMVQAPTVNIFLTKNEKVIKIVNKAQSELREVLESEIKEE